MNEKIVAIANQKGGTAKTTTAVNLAASLAERGQRVLLIDLDPQHSASMWLGVHEAGRDLLNVFTGNASIAGIIRDTGIPQLSIIPSSTWLVGVEQALAGEVGREMILRRQLAILDGQWDYVLLDCPPTLGVLTLNALTAARSILVPVEAHILAIDGLAQLMRTVTTVQERLNGDLAILGILPCRVDQRTRHSLQVVERLREKFDGLVFRTIIRENVRVAEAPSFATPVTVYDPSCAAATDYRALAEEILARTQENQEWQNGTPSEMTHSTH